MRRAIVLGAMCLLLSACGVLNGIPVRESTCSRYVKGFTAAAETCNLTEMDKYAFWIDSMDIAKECTYDELRRFERAAESCGLGG